MCVCVCMYVYIYIYNVYIYIHMSVCVCVLLSLYNLHINFGPQTRDSLIGSNWPIYLMPKSKHFNSCWPRMCGTNIHQQYLTMTLFLIPWWPFPFCSQLCRVQGSARGLPGCGLNMIEHTVDGRNPAPVDRWFIPLFIGF